jgi:hypothetical protein
MGGGITAALSTAGAIKLQDIIDALPWDRKEKVEARGGRFIVWISTSA